MNVLQPYSLIGLLVLPWALAAQEHLDYFCFDGPPRDECAGFVHVEFRGGGVIPDRGRFHLTGEVDPDGRLVSPDSVAWRDIGDWFGGEVAYLVAAGEAWAWGGGIAVEWGEETRRVHARMRLRRWLAGRAYVELLPGIFRQRRSIGFTDVVARNLGFSSELRAGVAGFLFASARYDALSVEPVTVPLSQSRIRFDPGGGSHQLSLGGGIEGRTAVVTAGVAAVLAAIAFGALLGSLPG